MVKGGYDMKKKTKKTTLDSVKTPQKRDFTFLSIRHITSISHLTSVLHIPKTYNVLENIFFQPKG